MLERRFQPLIATHVLTQDSCSHADVFSRLQQGGGATWLQLTSLAGTSHTRPVVTDAIVPGTPDTGPAWGYHGYEYNLALGSLLHDVAGEEAGWQSSH